MGILSGPMVAGVTCRKCGNFVANSTMDCGAAWSGLGWAHNWLLEYCKLHCRIGASWVAEWQRSLLEFAEAAQ